MDSDQVSISSSSPESDLLSRPSLKGDVKGLDDEDPFSLNDPSVALLGLAIAFASVVIPITVVLTERQLGQESMLPQVVESDGSNSSLPISFSRVGEFDSGDSSREPKQI